MELSETKCMPNRVHAVYRLQDQRNRWVVSPTWKPISAKKRGTKRGTEILRNPTKAGARLMSLSQSPIKMKGAQKKGSLYP